jgi:ribosome-associated translation inhibitor RaiA
LKTLHGQFEFKVQRFIERTRGAEQEVTYFDLTDQFQEDYVSDRLKEFSTYYSNRLSYEDMAGLVERVTGSRQLSDQKIRQVVVNKALKVSQATRVEVEERLNDKTKSFPKIQDKVDIYDSQSHEILVFEEHPITHNSASY